MDNQEWTRLRGELESADSLSNLKKIAAWQALDCPTPSLSAYKQELVKSYARTYDVDTLIETGTYLGDMVQACKAEFKDIYSIELSQELYSAARKRFRDNKTVHLYQGDSGEVVRSILKKLSKPAIFWLDAHYSEGITAKGKLNTPIIEEVEAILSHKVKSHVVLIDDSRIFTGQDDYPTVSAIRKKFLKLLPNSSVIDRHDVIRVQPDPRFVEV